MNEPNEPTAGDRIAAIGNVLRELNQNRKAFDQELASRYEGFVRVQTSKSDAIATKQLVATIGRVLSRLITAGVTLIFCQFLNSMR